MKLNLRELHQLCLNCVVFIETRHEQQFLIRSVHNCVKTNDLEVGRKAMLQELLPRKYCRHPTSGRPSAS